MIVACENAVVLRLDAFDGSHPALGITTTTRRRGVTLSDLREAETKLWRQLRRKYGNQIAYCAFLEWTTGQSSTSGGYRRPHLHHTVKGLEYFDGLETEVSEMWKHYSPDGAWRVEARPLRTPMGAIAYLVLHHHKREQGPPPGTRHAKRLRPSRGYFNRPVAEYRLQARELLRDDRLYAELVNVLAIPDGAPSYLVDELVIERLDDARERATFDKPKLVHVRETRHVDRATGEIVYEFLEVLGLASERAA